MDSKRNTEKNNKNNKHKNSDEKTTTLEIPVEYEDRLVEYLKSLDLTDFDNSDDNSDKTTDWKQYNVNGDDADVVTRIIGHKYTRGILQFEIRWVNGEVGWTEDRDCSCEALIKKYFREHNVDIITVYCFCRVSSPNQVGPTHVSLQMQAHKLHRVAQKKFGTRVRIKVIKLQASVYKTVPPLFTEIAHNTHAGDAILIYRADRLSRNIGNYLHLLDTLSTRGVYIYSDAENIWYGENRTGFLQLILDAEKESEKISKRVKASIRARKHRGDECLGRPEYGYRTIREENTFRIKKLLDKKEQRIIRFINKSDDTATDIATNLNNKGRFKRGRKWTTGMIKYIRNKDDLPPMEKKPTYKIMIMETLYSLGCQATLKKIMEYMENTWNTYIHRPAVRKAMRNLIQNNKVEKLYNSYRLVR